MWRQHSSIHNSVCHWWPFGIIKHLYLIWGMPESGYRYLHRSAILVHIPTMLSSSWINNSILFFLSIMVINTVLISPAIAIWYDYTRIGLDFDWMIDRGSDICNLWIVCWSCWWYPLKADLVECDHFDRTVTQASWQLCVTQTMGEHSGIIPGQILRLSWWKRAAFNCFERNDESNGSDGRVHPLESVCPHVWTTPRWSCKSCRWCTTSSPVASYRLFWRRCRLYLSCIIIWAGIGLRFHISTLCFCNPTTMNHEIE